MLKKDRKTSIMIMRQNVMENCNHIASIKIVKGYLNGIGGRKMTFFPWFIWNENNSNLYFIFKKNILHFVENTVAFTFIYYKRIWKSFDLFFCDLKLLSECIISKCWAVPPIYYMKMENFHFIYQAVLSLSQ